MGLVNESRSIHAEQFWTTLKQAETLILDKFKSVPLVCAQAQTNDHAMTACTLQVQLCEYRQFRHCIARMKYGLPEDETMRGEDERKTALAPEDFVELNEEKRCIEFDIPIDDRKIHFEVSLAAVGNRNMVACRVAEMCFIRLREGMSKPDVEKFRDTILAGHVEDEDVPDDSPAWVSVKGSALNPSAPVQFSVKGKDGQKVQFLTTVPAAGGSTLEAERIARLCWMKLKTGSKKEDVLEYRNMLYKKRTAQGAAGGLDSFLAKRPRTSTEPASSLSPAGQSTLDKQQRTLTEPTTAAKLQEPDLEEDSTMDVAISHTDQASNKENSVSSHKSLVATGELSVKPSQAKRKKTLAVGQPKVKPR